MRLILSSIILSVLLSTCSRVSDIQVKNNEIFVPYRKGNKWEICNEKKEFIVEPFYDRAYPIDGELFIAEKDADIFTDDLCLVCRDKKYGSIEMKNIRIFIIRATIL